MKPKQLVQGMLLLLITNYSDFFGHGVAESFEVALMLLHTLSRVVVFSSTMCIWRVIFWTCLFTTFCFPVLGICVERDSGVLDRDFLGSTQSSWDGKRPKSPWTGTLSDDWPVPESIK